MTEIQYLNVLQGGKSYTMATPTKGVAQYTTIEAPTGHQNSGDEDTSVSGALDGDDGGWGATDGY